MAKPMFGLSDVKDKKVFLVCTLDQPDTKLLPLYWRRPQKNLEPKAYCLIASYMHQTKLSIEVKVSPQRILQI
jgi:hypothetical protein